MGIVERLVAVSLRQRLFVLLCLAAIVVTGVVAYRELPVEAFPDLTNNQVVVVAEAPGLAATEVEQRVTYPVETALMGVPGAEQVRSISKAGLAVVTIVFEDRVPIYFARQLVSERLADARGRLPAGIEPVLGPVATAFGEIYQYLVEGDTAEPMERKALHDWEVRARLRSVKGVSEVNSWGGFTRQYQVIVDPYRLDRYGLTLREVFDAIARNNESFSGGFIEHRAERYTVRGTGLVEGEADLRRIVIAAHDGVPVFVSDVGDVAVAAMPRYGAVTRDGKGETLAGMVIMLKGENGKAVAERVKDRLHDIAATLPQGVTVTPFYDQTEVIDRTAHTVRKNLLEGSLLVIVVLFVFLRDVPAALITAAIIPVAMLIGFIGMRLFGVSANLMSLGAIDFGLIVDGGVVMMENFIRRRGEVHHQSGPDDEAGAHRLRLFTSSATEVARPILFGVLIIIAVYLPIFTLEGLEGKMFRPMAITVCSAILGSLFLSLTVVPVVSSYLLRLGGVHHEEAWFVRLRTRYVEHLTDAMDHPRRTLAVAVAVVALALGSIPFLGTEFMPKLDEGALLIETRKLPSVSLESSVELSTRVEQLVKSFPEVKQVVTKIGRPDVATEAMGIYQGDVYVLLHPIETWTTGRTKEMLIAAMSETLASMPGVSFNFTQPMAMRLDEVVSGVKADVAVKIFGSDPATLERLGADIQRTVARVQGVADLQTEQLSGAAQLQIAVDRGQIARYGLNVDDVRQAVETVVGGVTATEVLDGPKRFPVVVRFPDALRADRAAIGSLMLTAPAGERVPLVRIADVRETQAPEMIAHEDAERRLVVQMNVRGRDIGGFVAEARSQVAAAVALPAGYRLEWGGQFENQARATARLALVVPLSIAIIFLLLFVTFGRLRQASLVIMNVPFALVGGIAALWLRGINLNLSAAVGFIALFGVAVLNGVVLIAAVNRLREQGQLLRPAVLSGAATRLRPVLMTALVASFGFIPMALSHGAGAEIQRPLATVVIGGVITSTLLTLIVLPTLYERIERRMHDAEDASTLARGSHMTATSTVTSRQVRRLAVLAPAMIAVWVAMAAPISSQTHATIAIRGHEQMLHLYGSPTGDPVVVSSGDGGWMHLGPHVAEVLAGRGMFVVGFDVKAYLTSFTSARTTLRTEDEPRDFRVLAQFASKANGKPPILVGVSEGAGLSVLAATDPETKSAIAGVIGLGLPDINELAWRWKDSLIYLTHQTPNEPTFSAAAIIDRVAPAPLAIIHSTHDEFVPLADVERMFREGREPKRLWIVNASNHRFSDNLDEFDRRLVEAIAWVRDHPPH